ncbi:hypothetical protein LC605_26740 [Nostoc sp. CHAB 5836]|uniref:hypothetical protein n=1 Tax=Nostoc sp. CHAB 5836 TaxID=2780404 RepID=UPI001E3F1883|nr:hypothetical protein [Nostoc sp. CHAB 5836]MCC5618622.1 hypothetical protein [Nostoc sp. CHAB 5836]
MTFYTCAYPLPIMVGFKLSNPLPYTGIREWQQSLSSYAGDYRESITDFSPIRSRNDGENDLSRTLCLKGQWTVETKAWRVLWANSVWG